MEITDSDAEEECDPPALTDALRMPRVDVLCIQEEKGAAGTDLKENDW